MNSTNERPSLIGSFTKGAMSSAFSGAMMAGIVSLVTPLLGAGTILATLTATAPLMIIATGLFGGAMAVKRVIFDTPSALATQPNFIPVPVPSVSGPALSAPMVAADMAPEADQPTKNWAAETGRNGDSQNRIQNIIAQGSMSDKDRASAILAARETATTVDAARG